MSSKTQKNLEYNVLVSDFNTKTFKKLNVLPYFLEAYKKAKNKPVTQEEFKEFVRKEGMYRYWSKCEYEILLAHWPPFDDLLKHAQKIDVWKQIEMNLDLFVLTLMTTINENRRKRVSSNSKSDTK